MKNKKGLKGGNLKKGIFLLPNLFTSLNLFCGFYAIIAAIDGKFLPAAISIIIAGVFDNLDGKIARVTGTTSKFGVEYDSLADVISFGIAPALMIYLWALKPFGRIGWLAAFLFMFILVLAANLFSDVVRDAFDPRAMPRPQRHDGPLAELLLNLGKRRLEGFHRGHAALRKTPDFPMTRQSFALTMRANTDHDTLVR